MSNSSHPSRNRSMGRGKARDHFETADARTKLVKRIVEAENAVLDARTVKLRALRLAKEEVERIEALANPKPPVPSAKKLVSDKSRRQVS